MPFPAFDAARFRFPEEQWGFPAQWDEAVRLLEGAAEVGVVDAPRRVIDPSVDEDTLAETRDVQELNRFRIRTVAEQLWLLGYLTKKPRKNISARVQASSGFQEGLRQFQQDARLIVDGWVGDQTWRALQAIVGFESHTETERWVSSEGSYCPAFRRAIQLRLFCYGLAKQRPGKNFNSVPAANSARAERCLSALGIYSRSRGDEGWVKLLFDHEILVTAASRFRSSFNDGLNLRGNYEQDFRRFLVNLAKIELWLLGSDITIDGKDDFPVAGLGVAKKWRRRAGRRRRVDATDLRVRKFLTQYWAELLELPPDEAGERALEISPALFRSLDNPAEFSRRSDAIFDEADYSLEVARQFEEHDDTEGAVEEAYVQSKGVGMKLFDGLRRLWKWVKQGIRKVVQFGKNLLRGFYRFALKSYVIVRTATSAFTRSLDQYVRGQIDTQRRVRVDLSRDFDSCVLLDRNVPPEEAGVSAALIRRFAAMFLFSTRILSLVVDLLKATFRGLWGWARLLMVLVKHYRELVPAYRDLVAVI